MDIVDQALTSMKAAAADKKVKIGAGVVLTMQPDEAFPRIGFFNLELTEFKFGIPLSLIPFLPGGVNFFGAALEKLATMFSTRENAGILKRKKKFGETKWPGGAYAEIGDMRIFSAFSGATAEIDTHIAETGMKVLKENLSGSNS